MHHLAQLNIARALAPMDDPIMEGFASRLDEVNALAEASPGYVWRLQDESDNATSFTPFDDPMMLVNLTLWESVQALRSYSYETEHARRSGGVGSPGSNDQTVLILCSGGYRRAPYPPSKMRYIA